MNNHLWNSTYLNSSRTDFIKGSHSIEDEFYNFIKIIIPYTPGSISQEYNICLGPFAYWEKKKKTEKPQFSWNISFKWSYKTKKCSLKPHYSKWSSIAAASPGSFLEMQVLGTTPDLLDQISNNKMPGQITCIIKFEKLLSNYPSTSALEFSICLDPLCKYMLFPRGTIQVASNNGWGENQMKSNNVQNLRTAIRGSGDFVCNYQKFGTNSVFSF